LQAHGVGLEALGLGVPGAADGQSGELNYLQVVRDRVASADGPGGPPA
jgi:hypothetical protein